MQGGCHMNKPPGDPPLVPTEQDLAKVYAFQFKLQRIIFFKQSSFLLFFSIIIILIIYIYIIPSKHVFQATMILP